MPIAGVARNPEGLTDFDRFHRNRLLLYTRDQDRRVRGTIAEPGTLRRLWRNIAEYSGAAPPFSWTANRFDGDPVPAGQAVTTPLRYLISTVNVLTAGNLLSNPLARRALNPSVAHPGARLILTGNVANRPTIRTRVPSFGSRVPALNQEIPGGTQ